MLDSPVKRRSPACSLPKPGCRGQTMTLPPPCPSSRRFINRSAHFRNPASGHVPRAPMIPIWSTGHATLSVAPKSPLLPSWPPHEKLSLFCVLLACPRRRFHILYHKCNVRIRSVPDPGRKGQPDQARIAHKKVIRHRQIGPDYAGVLSAIFVAAFGRKPVIKRHPSLPGGRLRSPPFFDNLTCPYLWRQALQQQAFLPTVEGEHPCPRTGNCTTGKITLPRYRNGPIFPSETQPSSRLRHQRLRHVADSPMGANGDN